MKGLKIMRGLSLAACALVSLTASAQDLYDPSVVTRIDLEFSQSNWDALLDNYKANDMDERLEGTCIVNGDTFSLAGVKYKGNSTYNANNAKNPLNIKLDYAVKQDYQGFETLKLSNGKNDPSFVREVLSYEIIRKYMVAPLSNYAAVYVNGDFHGMYSSAESINGDFAERRLFAKDDNPRMKCNPESNFGGNGSSLEYLGDDPADYHAFYELKSDEGWSSFVLLTKVIEQQPENIELILDIDKAIWMLALNNVLVNLDSYTGPFRQNYYLIQDNNGIFIPIIWDLNESIGGFEMINVGPGATEESLQEMEPLLRQEQDGWPLLNLVLGNETYRRMYIAHCRTILEENFVNGWYEERAIELQEVVRGLVEQDENSFYTLDEFNSNMNTSVRFGTGGAIGITQLMEARKDFLLAHEEFSHAPPVILNTGADKEQVNPHTEVYVTAEVSGADEVTLAYRHSSSQRFEKVEMKDDGQSGDGVAGDGIYGVKVMTEATDLQYYVYAEDGQAGAFSPARASHEFHRLGVSGDLVINELMASGGQFSEETGSGDWIELKNNSSQAISLKGYYLTDNSGDPTKWAFPDREIGAGEYLIVWANKDTTDTDNLYANFKLSASGETVMLFDSEYKVVDEVVFGVQSDGESYGRYPDGTGAFQVLNPTFSDKNSVVQSIERQLEQSGFSLYPNPASSVFNLQAKSSEIQEMRVFDLLGNQVHTQRFRNNLTVSTETWAPGIYLVQIGQGAVQKLIIE